VAGSAAELSIKADASEVRRASAWLEATAMRHRVPAEQMHRLDLCLNEALANIITHGGPSARASPVRLVFQTLRGPGSAQAEVMVSDGGVAFDPREYKQKPGPRTLSETEPGDLGLVMMHGFADDLSYRFSEGRNQLTFRVLWTEPE